MKTSKSQSIRKWLNVIEFVVINLATWLNPEAGLLLFLLKFCFLILRNLQEKEDKQ